MTSLQTSTKKSQSSPEVESKLPNCRNYWRLGASSPSLPQSPPSYLLKPHLIASSSMCSDSEGRNPNSKYFKLRHGPGACQFSPLNDDLIGYHQYRVRLPFDPTPFRGVTRLLFWIVFVSILALLFVLITSLLSVEDFHSHHKYTDNITQELQKQRFHEEEMSLSDSLLFKALNNRRL